MSAAFYMSFHSKRGISPLKLISRVFFSRLSMRFDKCWKRKFRARSSAHPPQLDLSRLLLAARVLTVLQKLEFRRWSGAWPLTTLSTASASMPSFPEQPKRVSCGTTFRRKRFRGCGRKCRKRSR